MRRLMAYALLVGFTVSSVGCIAATSIRGSVKVAEKQAVVLNDQIYIVDVGNGNVCRINPNAVADAAEFSPVEDEAGED